MKTLILVYLVGVGYAGAVYLIGSHLRRQRLRMEARQRTIYELGDGTSYAWEDCDEWLDHRQAILDEASFREGG